MNLLKLSVLEEFNKELYLYLLSLKVYTTKKYF